MAFSYEPKLISGNSNRPLSNAISRRLSMHRGKPTELVNARIERFNDQEIFVEVYENVRGEDMFIIQSTSNPTNDNFRHARFGLVCEFMFAGGSGTH